MNMSELHDCPKCHGKIVCIVCNMGETRCGYCNERVDYTQCDEFIEAQKKIEEMKTDVHKA